MEIKERELETQVKDPMDDVERKKVDWSKTHSQFIDSDAIIKQMEQEWPEMTEEFKKIQRQQYVLFLHKQHDYGPGNISVGTQLQTEDEIHLSLTGLWFRMNDKIQRLKNLLMNKRESAVKDEPMEDAYLDVSNYGIMATIVSRGKWGK